MVDAASRPALAVDIMAASAAAISRPRMPSGRVVLIISAKALFGLARSGISTCAAMPIAAQARPYSTQYTPAVVPARWQTFSSRAVNTRCQMSWPMRMPKK
ncbi:hypothetical protein D3C86_1804490 [compost metagenome]